MHLRVKRIQFGIPSGNPRFFTGDPVKNRYTIAYGFIITCKSKMGIKITKFYKIIVVEGRNRNIFN